VSLQANKGRSTAQTKAGQVALVYSFDKLKELQGKVRNFEIKYLCEEK
jgi:hypothetical protein